MPWISENDTSGRPALFLSFKEKQRSGSAGKEREREGLEEVEKGKTAVEM